MSSLELSWHLWMCHLDTDVLQQACNEAHGPLKVKSSSILGLADPF